MRQVPLYLLIGNGRVSRHMQYYFSLLHIPFSLWTREQSLAELNEKINLASHILILISDQAIDGFARQHLLISNATRIHFSGSLVTPHAYGAHPLMTFSTANYDLATYQQIPFIVDHEAPAFSQLLPGLSNPHAQLDPALKAKYHALCVMSGNFSCLLWQAFFDRLHEEFQLPLAFAKHYLRQQTKNILTNYESALTGPLTRKDDITIKKNLHSLQGDSLQKLYRAFVDYYTEEFTYEKYL